MARRWMMKKFGVLAAGLIAGAFVLTGAVAAQADVNACENACIAEEESCYEACGDADDVGACENECKAIADACVEDCNMD